MADLAPIVLFVYNRVEHTHQTVEALLDNELAKQSELFVFSDAAKTKEHESGVFEVRRNINSIVGFKSITIIERESNYGLAKSIIDGVTEVIKQYGKVIVLEDDMVTSPYFLTYMNEALVKYANNEKVACIHGYTYPVSKVLPDSFFLRGADCWGWATWERGWNCFNSDGKYLLNELRRKNLINQFDFNGAYPFSKMLEEQVNGDNDSWAIRWYASAFLDNKLTLYPGRSLVNNIGNDDSGTHCISSSNLEVSIGSNKVMLEDIVEESEVGRMAFEMFFRSMTAGKLKRFINNTRTKIEKWFQ
jgi:hypothetical protein